MLSFNEEDLKAAVITKAVDEIVGNGDHFFAQITKGIDDRLNALFAEHANAQIASAINNAITFGFDREYQRVTAFGQPSGSKTTIRAELERLVGGYWNALVDKKTGKPSDNSYSSTTRAEFLMTQICAEDFSESLKQSALNITGALKDGLRTQLAKQMDAMLGELFRVKSLQDQGKVEKPY